MISIQDHAEQEQQPCVGSDQRSKLVRQTISHAPLHENSDSSSDRRFSRRWMLASLSLIFLFVLQIASDRLNSVVGDIGARSLKSNQTQLEHQQQAVATMPQEATAGIASAPLRLVRIRNAETTSTIQQQEQQPRGREQSTPTQVKKYALSTAAPETPKKKKHFVIHMGPQKTATTYIQQMASMWESTFLRADNYTYLGKMCSVACPTFPPPLYASVKDLECRHAVTEAMAANRDMPPCWHEFVQRFDAHTTTTNHILISSEDLFFGRGNNTGWWQAVKALAEYRGYDVMAILAYRRLFEWLPSAHTQRNRGGRGSKQFSRWPGERRGGYAKPFFPTLLTSLYVNQTHGRFLHFDWNPTLLAAMEEANVPVRTINLHDPISNHSTVRKFYCDALPDAPNACQESIRLEQEPPPPGIANPSTSLAYDYLITMAAKYGHVHTQRYTRRQIEWAAKQYQHQTLNRTDADFDWICPTPAQVKPVLDASIYWENVLMPPPADIADEVEAAHTTAFWKLMNSSKVCFVDVNATLAKPEWKQFFLSYARRSARADLMQSNAI